MPSCTQCLIPHVNEAGTCPRARSSCRWAGAAGCGRVEGPREAGSCSREAKARALLCCLFTAALLRKIHAHAHHVWPSAGPGRCCLPRLVSSSRTASQRTGGREVSRPPTSPHPTQPSLTHGSSPSQLLPPCKLGGPQMAYLLFFPLGQFNSPAGL